MTNRKIIAGLLTGIAAGVAIGLVLSSKKGRETSRKFLKEGIDRKDDLKNRFNAFIDQVQGKAQKILK
jgi:gas vesicle protein